VLGLALGPIGAVGAVRRARVGFVRNDLLPLDTPMGTVSTGPLVNSVAGPDLLLLGLPTVVAMTGPLTWTQLALQAGLAALGVRLYLTVSTSGERVDLRKA
jgi:hypothetical protein